MAADPLSVSIGNMRVMPTLRKNDPDVVYADEGPENRNSPPDQGSIRGVRTGDCWGCGKKTSLQRPFPIRFSGQRHPDGTLYTRQEVRDEAYLAAKDYANGEVWHFDCLVYRHDEDQLIIDAQREELERLRTQSPGVAA